MKYTSQSLGPGDTSRVMIGLHSSRDYRLKVNEKPVHVLTTATVLGGPASFASFTVEGKTRVVIKAGEEVTSAKVLPTSYGITPAVAVHTIEFEIDRPGQFTVEINGSYSRAFHLFANPPETDAPSPHDPKVTYLGPGVHERQNIFLRDGETLYLAEGAILRAKLPEGTEAPADTREHISKRIPDFIQAHHARNIKICGRGIIDLSTLPWHSLKAIIIENCTNVVIEGITMIDAPDWDIGIFKSNNVHIKNVKQISPRENSDGIDISNSQDVIVEDCFLRNNDDEICVKTLDPAPAQPARRILVQNCIIWNERARGLGITSETRQDIDDVVFRNCDIIHDFATAGPCAALAVLISDSGTISNIRFEDIRIEDVKNQLILCWLGKDRWGHDKTRGHLNGVTFKNITVTGDVFPKSTLEGYNEEHLIENVTFDNVLILDKLVRDEQAGQIRSNAFVRGVRFDSID